MTSEECEAWLRVWARYMTSRGRSEESDRFAAAADTIDVLTAELDRLAEIIRDVASSRQREANSYEGTSYGDGLRKEASELLAALNQGLLQAERRQR